MSGILKSIGRVFKKAVKAVKKVALPVLAIGAVIVTGGAALGALPAVGSLVGTSVLGSTALASAITTGITTAGLGGAIGFVTSGGKLKGLTKGALVGGLTGGVLGAAGAMTANAGAGGAMNLGIGKAGTIAGMGQSAAGVAPGEAASGLIDPVLSGGVDAASAAGASIGEATATTAAKGLGSSLVAKTGGGLLGGMDGIGKALLLGNVINGLGSGLTQRAQAQDEKAKERRIRESYAGTGGLWMTPQGLEAMPTASTQFAYDPGSKRIVRQAMGE